MGSSQTRARTRVPCIGRQILNHCATREAPLQDILKCPFFKPESNQGASIVMSLCNLDQFPNLFYFLFNGVAFFEETRLSIKCSTFLTCFIVSSWCHLACISFTSEKKLTLCMLTFLLSPEAPEFSQFTMPLGSHKSFQSVLR